MFDQIDYDQYDSHTSFCTVFVRSAFSYQHQLSVTYSFDYHVHCQIYQRNHLNLIFWTRTISRERRSVLLTVSLILEFLIHVFTNFIFEKLLSDEALVAGRVTTNSNNLYEESKAAP